MQTHPSPLRGGDNLLHGIYRLFTDHLVYKQLHPSKSGITLFFGRGWIYVTSGFENMNQNIIPYEKAPDTLQSGIKHYSESEPVYRIYSLSMH
jgi:hypothetical protein